MAILYSYPETLELLPADMLIGTSTIRVAGKKKNITKNFTLELLKSFILDGNTGVQWGTITGTLSNQTDLQAALNAKQGNITLTTTGSSGAATFVGNILNIPNYSTSAAIPTLSQVLTAGNSASNNIEIFNGNAIRVWASGGVGGTLSAALFEDGAVYAQNQYLLGDNVGISPYTISLHADPLIGLTSNRVQVLQDKSGTIALTSDIPSLTGYVPYTGATQSINLGTFNLTANSIIKQGGTSTQFLMADGTVTIGNGGVYSYEIHVSQIDGNDITGTGALLNPVATITKALTLITGLRRTIVIHPGNYTENPNVTFQYTVLTTYAQLGGNTLITGTISTNTGCTISGLKMTNLNITAPTGQGNVNILNCDVSGTLTKSSTGDYTLIRFTDIGATNITSSAGLIAIFGGNPNFITINNAGARVIVKNAVTVAPILIAGNANFVDCIIIATTGTSNAITTSAGTIVTLANSQIVVPTFNNVARVSLSGFYSIFNTVFDKPNSFLISLSGTGGTTNSIDYFQFINADKFIKQGGTSLEYLMADGSVSTLTNPITGTGTTNYVSKFTSTTTLGNGLIYDDGTNVSIGSTTGLGLFNVSGTKTAATGIGRGINFTPTLTAAANGDTLVGLDIQPTFVNGAFTGVTNGALRVNGNILTSSNSTNDVGSSVNQFLTIWSGTFRSISGGQTRWGATSAYNFYNSTNFVAQFAANTGNLILQNGGTFTDVASSRLTVNSTTQGMLPPRMTTAQKNAIASPATGLIVYDTDLKSLYQYNGTSWLPIGYSGVHALVKPSVGSSVSVSVTSTALSAQAQTANRLIVSPFIPSQTITCASLYINVATLVAGSNAQILIYSNLNGKPDTKIYQSANLDCSTAGNKIATTTQTFEAGNTYWIGVHTSATQSLTVISVANLLPIFITSTTQVSSFFITPTFGSAPTTFGTPSNNSATIPYVGITI